MDKLTQSSFSNYEVLTSYTSADTSTATDQIYIVPNTLEVWASVYSGTIWTDPVKVGYDTSGTIVTVSPYTTSGSVVYIQNEVTCSCPQFSGITSANLEIALIYKTKDGNGNQTTTIGVPIKLSNTPGSIRRMPDSFGQSTKSVLKEFGYTDEKIKKLAENGVI